MVKNWELEAQDIRVTLKTTEAEFLKLFESGLGDINLILEVYPEDIFTSTGMVSIRSGVITLDDVVRALDAALTLQSSHEVIVPINNDFNYVIDECVRSMVMPIGLPGMRLDVSVQLVRIPKKFLLNWNMIAVAFHEGLRVWQIALLAK